MKTYVRLLERFNVGMKGVYNGNAAHIGVPKGMEGKVVRISEPHTAGRTSDVIQVKFPGMGEYSDVPYDMKPRELEISQ